MALLKLHINQTVKERKEKHICKIQSAEGRLVVKGEYHSVIILRLNFVFFFFGFN